MSGGNRDASSVLRRSPEQWCAIVGPEKPEARLMARVQEQHREERRVDVPLDVADVVARALVEDPLHLVGRRSRRLQQQLEQSFVAVAHRRAIDVEDVAELQPDSGALQLDDQKV
jgi:hypothetical protein